MGRGPSRQTKDLVPASRITKDLAPSAVNSRLSARRSVQYFSTSVLQFFSFHEFGHFVAEIGMAEGPSLCSGFRQRARTPAKRLNLSPLGITDPRLRSDKTVKAKADAVGVGF